MVKKLRSFIVYGLILVAALWLNTTFAQTGYEAAIYDACARHGCDGSQLVRVMYCESGGAEWAVGPNGELGIFQVDPAYWGYMDSWQQIEFAAHMFATGQGYHWVCQ
jgi:hypothetical protein